LSCQHATSTAPADNRDAASGRQEDVLDGYRDLLECLEAVPEPRRRHGTRHRLAVVLAYAVAAVLAGADSVTAISEWAAEAPEEVLAALGARWDRRGRRRVAPSPATFRRILKRVDATAVAAAFGTWLAGQLATVSADLDGLVIALDGKTMRGARTAEEKAPHLLAAMICGARIVIAQRDVDQKQTRSPRSSLYCPMWTYAVPLSRPMLCMCSGKPPATWSKTSTPTTCSPR